MLAQATNPGVVIEKDGSDESVLLRLSDLQSMELWITAELLTPNNPSLSKSSPEKNPTPVVYEPTHLEVIVPKKTETHDEHHPAEVTTCPSTLDQSDHLNTPEQANEEPVKKKFGFGKKSVGGRTKMALLQGLRNGSLEKAVEKMEADTSTPVLEADVDERLVDNEKQNEFEEETLCFEQIQVGSIYYLKTADGLQQVFENEDSIWSQEVSGNTTEDTEVTPNNPNNSVYIYIYTSIPFNEVLDNHG